MRSYRASGPTLTTRKKRTMSQPRWELEHGAHCLYLGRGLVVAAWQLCGVWVANLYLDAQTPGIADGRALNLGVTWTGRDLEEIKNKVEDFWYGVRRQLNLWSDR